MIAGDDGMDDDESDYGAPAHLTMPEGTEEEQLAWLRARVQEGLDSGPAREGTVDELFDGVIRRGRERLEQSKPAA